jgi:hypothetical protein
MPGVALHGSHRSLHSQKWIAQTPARKTRDCGKQLVDTPAQDAEQVEEADAAGARS